MKVLLYLLLALTLHAAIGQTVSIPDTNFRNKLITSYPQVMQGKALDPVKAAALTGTLDLRFSNIADASGVQYFTGISTLDLSNNKISVFPDISATTGLVNFYATNNRLTSLPDMSSLTQLRDFQVMNNQLTALPDLSGATGLLHLYCSSNDITLFPPLTQFPNLIDLVIGDNPFTNPIDFSSCVNLQQLHIHKTATDTIIGLEKLKKLTILYAWGNNIRNLSGLDSIKTLTLCVVFENPLKDLPYLANKPNLNNLNVYNCLLTFEDIIPVLQQTSPATFIYAPQRPVQMADVTARAQHAYSLKYPVDAPLPGNKYVWIKDGVILDSSASPSYTFPSLTFSDSGNYTLKVYNTAATALILNSDTFHLSVSPCIEFKIPSLTITSRECAKGYTIDLSNARISGGTPPYSYELNNGLNRKKYNDVVLENIPAGKYEIVITDSRNCTAKENFVLNPIEKCDLVITPNGDGIADSYFIEKSGQVKIYDLKRRLVNTLEAPIEWNGTDQNGNLLDAGYYVLIMDGISPVYISIIR